MLGFLLWCVLFILCWPLALAALFLYPIVWLLLLPFRILGIAVGGVLELVWAIITLPARVIAASRLVDVNPLHSRVNAAQHAVGDGAGQRVQSAAHRSTPRLPIQAA